jgi:hypothetical protein
LIFEGGLSTLDDEIQSITEVPGAVATISPGDDLPLTPSLQANLAISVPIDLNERFALTPRIDGTYSSDLVFITGSVPLIEQDAYGVGNVSLTLTDSQHAWRLTAGVLNLFDERYLVQGNASLATLGYAETIYARPRSWFLQFSGRSSGLGGWCSRWKTRTGRGARAAEDDTVSDRGRRHLCDFNAIDGFERLDLVRGAILAGVGFAAGSWGSSSARHGRAGSCCSLPGRSLREAWLPLEA